MAVLVDMPACLVRPNVITYNSSWATALHNDCRGRVAAFELRALAMPKAP